MIKPSQLFISQAESYEEGVEAKLLGGGPEKSGFTM